MTISNLGRRGFILLTHPYHSQSSKEIKTGIRSRNLRQELMQRPEKSTPYCLLMTYSASFLTESWTSSLWVVVPIVVWVLLYKSSTKKYTIAFPTHQPIEAHLPKSLYLLSSWHKTSNIHTETHMYTHTYVYTHMHTHVLVSIWVWRAKVDVECLPCYIYLLGRIFCCTRTNPNSNPI